MITRLFRTTTLTALAMALSAAGPLAAQGDANELALNSAVTASRDEGGKARRTALDRGRFAVVIDLDENQLHFRQGELTLWSAKIGTGTGLRLQTDEHDWDFSTPNGTFHVQYKEENPIWIAPDWYFVENGLPVPPANDKKRMFPGGLGAAAVYIGHDLAIHGTDKPELLGQRVSHGCIRLSNKDAMRLYHNVQVGTEVIIVGGRDPDEPQKVVGPNQVPKTFDPKKAKKVVKEPVVERWKALDTPALVAELNIELWRTASQSRWTEVASLLLDRGLSQEEDVALLGLLAQAGSLPNATVAREYGTYLADAYGRSAMRTMAVLSEMTPVQRKRAATAIVDATMLLHPGELDATATPWPTRRVPRTAVDYQARRGWNALAAAEEAYREQLDTYANAAP